MTVCDICSKPTKIEDGFALTTKQVVETPAYWADMIDQHSLDDTTLLLYIQQQAIQAAGWLVCVDCSDKFEFDHGQARRFAREGIDPQGSGPADVNRTAAAAAQAWQDKYGEYPSWLK